MPDMLLIAFIGWILGAVALTVYNYIWAALNDTTIKWDHKYTMTMLMSVIISTILSMSTFMAIQFPTDGTFYVFIFAFTQSFATNHVVNKPISFAVKKVNNSAPK